MQNNVSARDPWKEYTGAASLAPGWRALNRIATVYTHILSMTVRANGVRKNRALHARIYYLYIPLGPCYSPTRSTMHSKMRYRRQANAESYADNSTLNEWIASCTSQGKSPKWISELAWKNLCNVVVPRRVFMSAGNRNTIILTSYN